MIAVDPTGKTFTAQPGSGVGTTLAGTIAVMSATMLNQGVYDLAEAALLLGRGPGQIARRAGPAGGHGGQGVFQSVVRLYLQRVQFNDAGQPSLWRPADRVELDPRIQAGAPCIEGTRVPTATIADLLQSEDAKDIALDFDLSVEDVFAAGAFEESLERGVALAL